MNQIDRKKQLRRKKKIFGGVIALEAASAFMINGFLPNIMQSIGIKKIDEVWNETVYLAQSIEIDETEENDRVLITTPYLSQEDKYPTGCECVSAAMLLQFWGYSYTVDDLIIKFLPMSQLRENRRGELSGVSPEQAFIGSPYLADSYGCYAPVICQVLEKAVESEHEVKNLTGMEIEQICSEYLDEGIPVLCWVTINMNPSSEGTSWRLEGENSWFTWISQEHCMVLLGYDQSDYYFHDPYNGNGLVQWEKSLVEMRYEELGCQAVAIT